MRPSQRFFDDAYQLDSYDLENLAQELGNKEIFDTLLNSGDYELVSKRMGILDDYEQYTKVLREESNVKKRGNLEIEYEFFLLEKICFPPNWANEQTPPKTEKNNSKINTEFKKTTKHFKELDFYYDLKWQIIPSRNTTIELIEENNSINSILIKAIIKLDFLLKLHENFDIFPLADFPEKDEDYLTEINVSLRASSELCDSLTKEFNDSVLTNLMDMFFTRPDFPRNNIFLQLDDYEILDFDIIETPFGKKMADYDWSWQWEWFTPAN